LAPPGAAAEPTVEGFWTGVIEVAGGEPQKIMIDVARADEGWRAAFYAPAQGIHGVDLLGFEVTGRSVGFRIPQARGEPTFKGELAEDGRTLSGGFTDDGQAMRFQLARAERPADLGTDIYAEYRRPGVFGVGLPGSWRALLVTGPNRMRLKLEVWSAEGGRLAATLISLDQGGAELPVDSFRVDGDSVRFEMLGIGAVYNGKMKLDGSEFTGLWIQTGREFPLTFRRRGNAAKE